MDIKDILTTEICNSFNVTNAICLETLQSADLKLYINFFICTFNHRSQFCLPVLF